MMLKKGGKEWWDWENITNRENWDFRKVYFTSAAEVTGEVKINHSICKLINFDLLDTEFELCPFCFNYSFIFVENVL